MKASELVGQTYWKGLIYGDAGVGKTGLAAQFPGPIEYWDFDNKFSSAVRYLTSLGLGERLEHIELHQFAKLKPSERIPAWEKRSKALDDLVNAGKPLPFKTLVIDSLTMFSHYMMEDYVFRSQLGIKRVNNQYSMQDYGLFGSHMTRFLTGILSRLDCNIVVLGHVETEKDELTGVISHKPKVQGRQIAPMLPAWFDEVYAAVVDSSGKRTLLTQPQKGYIARSQRGLPKEIPMDVKELLK